MNPHPMQVRDCFLAVLITCAVLLPTGAASAQTYGDRHANLLSQQRWSSTWATASSTMPYGKLVNTWQFQRGVYWPTKPQHDWYAGRFGNPVYGPIPWWYGSPTSPYVYLYGHAFGAQGFHYSPSDLWRFSHIPRIYRRLRH
jgi:hypothetical protein